MDSFARFLAEIGQSFAERLASFSTPAYAGFFDSVDSLARQVHEAAVLKISFPWDQIGKITPPSLSLLADPIFDHPTGVLCPVTDSPVMGFLTWKDPLADVGDWGLESAGWLGADGDIEKSEEYSRVVEVHCKLFCVFCGGRLVMMEERYEHRSSSEVEGEIHVLPLCPACIERSGGAPDYWLDQLRDIADQERPTYRLIDGDGEGSGKPEDRSHLHLVKAEDEDEPEEPEE